jgi:alanine dehydrogenase
MIVGVPREIKQDEYRVGMLPVGVEELTQAGHRVVVERGAGMGSGIPDEQYAVHGAEIVAEPADLYAEADLVVKVKEPQPDEWRLLRRGQMLFTYFHFAADERLTRGVLKTGVTAIAYETLEGRRGDLPCLTPMSEVAGRMSIQEGAKYLERPQEGRGILLGGVPGVPPAHILILGGGIVGKNAAQIAAGFQADVVIMDISVDRLRYLEDIMPANVNTLFSDRHNIREQLRLADLVIGAVLIPGARAPRLVGESDLALMKPGAVIIDVAIDQGGCFATSKPTTHSEPTYIVDGVVHYCVTNMPGAVGRTSTLALCNVTFPYALKIANLGLEAACAAEPGLTAAVNMHGGKVTNRAVAETFGMEYAPPE